jgi:hypothetical protein
MDRFRVTDASAGEDGETIFLQIIPLEELN